MTTGRTIYFYLKFFEKPEFAADFMSGRLWMNSLEYFKKLEGSADDGRLDPHEAPSHWLQPKDAQITFAGISIPPEDLAGPVIIQENRYDTWNVFCLYAGHSGIFQRLSAENMDAFRLHLRVPSRVANMGTTAVLVRNVSEFNARFQAAVRRRSFSLKAGLVEYFDPASFSGPILKPTHAKRIEFEWQREYRFALDRGAPVSEHHVFDIGRLDDICNLVDPSTFNDLLRVSLGEHLPDD